MSLRLLLDEHVPFEITVRLRAAGVDVLTAQDDGSDGLEDVELLERAATLGRELVTQDQDLLVEGARRQRDGIGSCGIFYAPQSVTMNKVYAEWLESYAKLCDRPEVANRAIFIP